MAPYPLDQVSLNALPTYRGAARSVKASEALIDAMYLTGDLDGLLKAIFAHVAQLYRSAPYNSGRAANEHLASIVTDEIARSLPSYSGAAPLTPYNPKRALLSHLVNLKARTKHLNELRNLNAKKRSVTVLADDLRSTDDRMDVLLSLSDRQQARRRGLYQPERDAALGTHYRWPLAGTLRVAPIIPRHWHYEQITNS